MPTYTACFRTDAASAEENFEAATADQALQMAREFLVAREDELFLQPHTDASEIDEIEIRNDYEGELAVWRSEDLQLRLAARDLLYALRQALAALNSAPRFFVPSLDRDSYAVAARCEQAIAQASCRTPESDRRNDV